MTPPLSALSVDELLKLHARGELTWDHVHTEIERRDKALALMEPVYRPRKRGAR